MNSKGPQYRQSFDWQPVATLGSPAFNVPIQACQLPVMFGGTPGQAGATQVIPSPVSCQKLDPACGGHRYRPKRGCDEDSDGDYRNNISGGRRMKDRVTEARLNNIEQYLVALDQGIEAAEAEAAAAEAEAQQENSLQLASYAAYQDSLAYYDALNAAEFAAKHAREQAGRRGKGAKGKAGRTSNGHAGHGCAAVGPTPYFVDYGTAYDYGILASYGYAYY